MPAQPRKLTDAQRSELLRTYRADPGKTVRQIAKEYGVSPALVSRMAKRAGLSRGGAGAAPPPPAPGARRVNAGVNAPAEAVQPAKPVSEPEEPEEPQMEPLPNGHVCEDGCRDMAVTDWVEAHRVLSQGPDEWIGQELMPLREMTPSLVEILEFAANPVGAERACILKGSRIGYTEAVIGNVIAFTIAVRPTRIAILQPTDTEAKKYSRDNIQSLVEHNPVLHRPLGGLEAQRGGGRRDKATTLLEKAFPGGRLTIIGSAASVNLRRFEAKLLFADEVDGMKINPVEGNPLPRFFKRSALFRGRGRVMLVGSTPTVRDASLIWDEWQRSDQRRWTCPCPHCGDPIQPEWKMIHWERQVLCGHCGRPANPDGQCKCGARRKKILHRPETAHLVCESCGGMIEDVERTTFLRTGRWVPTNPAGRYPGWHVPAYISLLPGAEWSQLAEEWVAAQGKPASLKAFVNEVLGETWVDKDKLPKVTKLEDRASQFVGPNGEVVVVPDGVGALTAGVDVQQDRLELLVRGWGAEDESWDIVHHRIWGDPTLRAPWQELYGWLNRQYRHRSGLPMRVACTLVDSGYRTNYVYQFTKPLTAQRIFASQGDAGRPGAAPVRLTGQALEAPHRESLAYKMKVPLWTIGTSTQKDALFARLKVREPGPNFVHLRAPDIEICNGFDEKYFKQFEAEVKVLVQRGGHREYRWIETGSGSNEAIDLHVMAAAAWDILDSALKVRGLVYRWALRAAAGKPPAAPAAEKRGTREWGEVPDVEGYV